MIDVLVSNWGNVQEQTYQVSQVSYLVIIVNIKSANLLYAEIDEILWSNFARHIRAVVSKED